MLFSMACMVLAWPGLAWPGLAFTGTGGAKPVKSTSPVSDVLGKYPPHSDTAAHGTHEQTWPIKYMWLSASRRNGADHWRA